MVVKSTLTELTEDPDFFRYLSVQNLPKDFPVWSDWVIKINKWKKKNLEICSVMHRVKKTILLSQ